MQIMTYNDVEKVRKINLFQFTLNFEVKSLDFFKLYEQILHLKITLQLI